MSLKITSPKEVTDENNSRRLSYMIISTLVLSSKETNPDI